MSKKALGRGIGALFSESGEESSREASSEIRMLPLDKIRENPNQPRTEFAEDALQELADSIRQMGILQPILVNDDGNDTYTIIAGERRYKAANRAGLTEVPVLIKHLGRIEQFETALIENIQREDLSPLEEARAYATLLKETGLTQDDVAKKVGKNRSTIANSLRLLKMPGEMLEALNSGDITAGHARAILSVVNPARQQGLFNLIMREGMSVRKAEEQAARLNLGQTGTAEKETAAKPAKKREPELAEFEQKLLERFGTKAEIHGSLSSGRIVLHFYSMEDLDRLINELMING